MTDRRKWLAVTGLFVVFILIQYAPIFFSGKIPFPALIVNGFPPYGDKYPNAWGERPIADIGDLVTQFYPYHALVSRELKQGRLPLWNPHVNSGEPLLGATQAGLFYPPNFLYFFMNVKRAWALEIVIERLFAGLFTILLVKELGGTPSGALISALLFAFCGFLTAWQGQAMVDAAVWLPLICYALLRLSRTDSWRSTALVAVSLAMPVLAGHPETAAHLAMTGLLVAGVLTFTGMKRFAPNLRFASKFVFACVIAMGVSAVQILPSVEWLANLHRSLGTMWGPNPLWSILGFVSRDIIRARNTAGLLIPVHAAYMGMITLVAVPLALLHPSRKLVVFLLVGAGAMLSIVYGVGPLLPLLHSIPFGGMKHSRLVLVATLALAVLAGLGVSVLDRWPKAGLSNWKAALLSAAGGIVALTMILFLQDRTTEGAERLSVPLSSAILLAIAAAAIFARIAGLLNKKAFSVLGVAVVSFDVMTFSYWFVPFVRANDIFPPVELFDRVKQLPGDPFRVAQFEGPYASNAEIVYDLDSASGYGIPLERFFRFMEGAGRAADDGAGPDSPGLLSMKDRRVDMLNTRYLLVVSSTPVAAELRKHPDRFRFMFSAGGTDVLENLKALPRVSVIPASGLEIVANEKEQLTRVSDPSFDPERSVVVSQDPGIAGGQTASSEAPSVVWKGKAADFLEMRITASQESIVVASQIYYPGWKATVDGETVPVIPANYALMAIPLSEGSHDVRFFYDPGSFKLGAAISLVSVFVLVILTFRREPQLPPQPSTAG